MALNLQTVKTVLFNLTYHEPNEYNKGDTVHWCELYTVVDYERRCKVSKQRVCFGTILEIGDFGYADGVIRAHVTKHYYDNDGNIVNYGYATIEEWQVVPPGTFKRMVEATA